MIKWNRGGKGKISKIDIFANFFTPKPMLHKVLKGIYFRIYVSKYFSCLQSLNELYSRGDKDEYLRKMEVFFSDLLRFPQIYYKNPQNIQSNNELIRSFTVTPGNPLYIIYSSRIELLLKIEQLIGSRSANELNNLSDNVGLFLDKLYNEVSANKRTSNRVRYSVSVAGVITLVFLFAVFYSPLKERYFEEKEQYTLVVNEEAYKQKTLKDVLELKAALLKYYYDNKSYPKSSGGFDAIIASFGESKEDWIPGLTPKYIKNLPVDPRKSKDSRKQYMYKSDGRDFKLIAHNPLGMNEIVNNHPELTDPVRPSWAFGAWSEGAKNW